MAVSTSALATFVEEKWASIQETLENYIRIPNQVSWGAPATAPAPRFSHVSPSV